MQPGHQWWALTSRWLSASGFGPGCLGEQEVYEEFCLSDSVSCRPWSLTSGSEVATGSPGNPRGQWSIDSAFYRHGGGVRFTDSGESWGAWQGLRPGRKSLHPGPKPVLEHERSADQPPTLPGTEVFLGTPDFQCQGNRDDLVTPERQNQIHKENLPSKGQQLGIPWWSSG